jgi:thioredoxin 1
MSVRVMTVAMIVSLSALSALAQQAASQPASAPADQTQSLSATYPGLASSGLVHARLAELSEGVLLRAGELTLTQEDVDAEIARAPEAVREQLRKNACFLLEQMATQKLLMQEARQKMTGAGGDERTLIQSYFQTLVKGAEASDREVAEFYEKNRELVGQATLEQVKEQIRQYLLQQKQQQIVDRHVQTIAQRMPVAVSAGWVKTQAELAKDNPVDKARASGKPTFANFGAKGCVPCDMMEPIREAVRKKYEGRLNVVFVHVGNEQVLASRYGVRAIPVLVFFDAEGREVFRHTGFFPQEKIEQKLAELGLK